MAKYTVRTRQNTCKLLKDMIQNKQRIVISRYCDGEANIFKGKKAFKQCGNDNSERLKPLLLRAIKTPDQIICINELKEHNIKGRDMWVKCQRDLARRSGQKVYGAGNWHLYDFQNGSPLLSKLFSGTTLVISGYGKDAAQAFYGVNPNVHFYTTRLKEASLDYEKYLSDLKEIVAKISYSNIHFCCGPTGKVLLSDLITVCKANLIDTGCLINAIIDGALYDDKRTVKTWPMSWANNSDIKKFTKNLFEKITNAISE